MDDIARTYTHRLSALPVVGNGYLFTRPWQAITPDVLSAVIGRNGGRRRGYPNLELYEAVKHSMASIVARESELAGSRRRLKGSG